MPHTMKRLLWRLVAPLLAAVMISCLLFDLPLPTNKGLSGDISRDTRVFTDLSASYLHQVQSLSAAEQSLLQSGFYPLHIVTDPTHKEALLSFVKSLGNGYRARNPRKNRLIADNYIMPSSCYYGLIQPNGLVTLLYFGDVAKDDQSAVYVAVVEILEQDHHTSTAIKLLKADTAMYQTIKELSYSLSAYGNLPSWVEKSKLKQYGLSLI